MLLGHKNCDNTTHYSGTKLAELIAAVNRIDASKEAPAITILRRKSCAQAAIELIAQGRLLGGYRLGG